MVCACSAIALASSTNKPIPQSNPLKYNTELEKLRIYIKDHPDKNSLKFKKSMVIILRRYFE